MRLISAITERLAIILAMSAQRLMNVHGRIETLHERKNPKFSRGDQIPLGNSDHPYTKLRADLVQEFVEQEKLTALIVFGCSYGTEVASLAKRLGVGVHLYGADLSTRVIEACSKYALPTAEFHVADMEDTQSVRSVLAQTKEHERVGVYFCETGPYVLPDRMQALFETLHATPNVRGVQVLEPLEIDWKSRFGIGAMFSYRNGFWYHNYYDMLRAAGFRPTRTDTISGSMRSQVHTDRPMWLVRFSKEIPT